MLPIGDFDLCLMWASVHFVFRTEARARCAVHWALRLRVNSTISRPWPRLAWDCFTVWGENLSAQVSFFSFYYAHGFCSGLLLYFLLIVEASVSRCLLVRFHADS